MKNFLLGSLLFISNSVIAQNKSCNLWLGDLQDSTNVLKQTTETLLGMQTKQIPAEAGVTNIIEMKDENGLAHIKIWLKPKKVAVAGAMTTIYVISSYKVVSLLENIDQLYKALQDKVSSCTTEATAANTVFGTNKMFIEKQGGDFSKKNLQMGTLTVTAK